MKLYRFVIFFAEEQESTSAVMIIGMFLENAKVRVPILNYFIIKHKFSTKILHF